MESDAACRVRRERRTAGIVRNCEISGIATAELNARELNRRFALVVNVNDVISAGFAYEACGELPRQAREL